MDFPVTLLIVVGVFLALDTPYLLRRKDPARIDGFIDTGFESVKREFRYATLMFYLTF